MMLNVFAANTRTPMYKSLRQAWLVPGVVHALPWGWIKGTFRWFQVKWSDGLVVGLAGSWIGWWTGLDFAGLHRLRTGR